MSDKHQHYKHQFICENHIYVMLDDKMKKKVTEDEFNNILEELSHSDLTDIQIKDFMNFTLPRVVYLDKFGIELVHELSMKLKTFEDEELVKKIMFKNL